MAKDRKVNKIDTYQKTINNAYERMSNDKELGLKFLRALLGVKEKRKKRKSHSS